MVYVHGIRFLCLCLCFRARPLTADGMVYASIEGSATVLVTRLGWHSVRIVVATLQVMLQLELEVAEPLREYSTLFDIDIAVMLYPLECQSGWEHSYYRSWWTNTVGQIALLLVVVALYFALRLCSGAKRDAASQEAAFGILVGIFLWCESPPATVELSPTTPYTYNRTLYK